jgi:heterotetrameric sarcosine oxidase gamma subunit
MAETPTEMVLDRPLPLKMHLRQGRYGAASSEGPGVRLWVRHPLSITTIIARKDQGSALSAALQTHYGIAAPPPGRTARGHGLSVQWCGDEQYYAISESRSEGALYRELKACLDGLASVSDQSHGRVILGVSGPKARTLLSKGSPVDFHPREFPLGAAAATQMAHIGVHVSRTGEDAFELSLFRGFSEHFWEWLCEQAQEFGYEIV